MNHCGIRQQEHHRKGKCKQLSNGAHGVRSVAVGWGYGTREELREAGFDFFASSVTELVAHSTNWMERDFRVLPSAPG